MMGEAGAGSLRRAFAFSSLRESFFRSYGQHVEVGQILIGQISTWHESIAEPTMADALCDRLLWTYPDSVDGLLLG
jgi:hypothetical protein